MGTASGRTHRRQLCEWRFGPSAPASLSAPRPLPVVTVVTLFCRVEVSKRRILPAAAARPPDGPRAVCARCDLLVRYHKDESFEGSRIVGFEVEPSSVKHAIKGSWKGGETQVRYWPLPILPPLEPNFRTLSRLRVRPVAPPPSPRVRSFPRAAALPARCRWRCRALGRSSSRMT